MERINLTLMRIKELERVMRFIQNLFGEELSPAKRKRMNQYLGEIKKEYELAKQYLQQTGGQLSKKRDEQNE